MKRSALPAALLTAAIALSPLAALADGNAGFNGYNNGGYHGGNHGGYRDGGAQTSGTISEVRGGMLRLQDGRPVFLHRGTVINPTGVSLQPGMRISVSGSRGGNGAINADVIEVARDWNGDRHDRNGGNGWNH
jgi:hypothetical protein